jgi:hypothetical protein
MEIMLSCILAFVVEEDSSTSVGRHPDRGRADGQIVEVYHASKKAL